MKKLKIKKGYIASYEETVADMDEVDYQKLWEMAEEYNSQIGNNTCDGDVFSQDEQNMPPM